ncbi:hypothetical protein [Streptomyces rapamycinicus]|uniref:Uncharacterized protein n=2 Tax=Streptomyces rapamycinicus TaxID=1226757 RepID=A0A0A0N3X4_STRRN|nr:hypothetical protein [Streptomyces rapamycinicus]AGP52932.1 hypothetical protein M271_06540 [Streptomyces rapamycinicus NRRL 5491]MBB4780409.1 hypothetical protein [Streptomyces rapamycinicus]RLV74937.1 hypothetical protein D3C57_136965 [Streptomyces rapamycinicus NRRL 5491]UTO61138.1 hypothetical protein LJB45_01580 [Streptomyces rapamycinicus]UTP29082.1 hypothetical protein LIV37_06700 [Streptomyces rapamycinicus NRRL 5491]
MLQLAEIRGRQAVWQRREPELVADGAGLPACSHPPTSRPAPLPSGPVETCVCTPLGPMAWSIVGGCSAATVGAAVAPRLLFPRRVPLAV